VDNMVRFRINIHEISLFTDIMTDVFFCSWHCSRQSRVSFTQFALGRNREKSPASDSVKISLTSRMMSDHEALNQDVDLVEEARSQDARFLFHRILVVLNDDPVSHIHAIVYLS